MYFCKLKIVINKLHKITIFIYENTHIEYSVKLTKHFELGVWNQHAPARDPDKSQQGINRQVE